MKSQRVNFTILEDTVSRLKDAVPEGNRSRFVAEAIAEKLDRIERERFLELLKRGYSTQADEEPEFAGEWDGATLENWP